jgi:hypothetical protein
MVAARAANKTGVPQKGRVGTPDSGSKVVPLPSLPHRQGLEVAQQLDGNQAAPPVVSKAPKSPLSASGNLRTKVQQKREGSKEAVKVPQRHRLDDELSRSSPVPKVGQPNAFVMKPVLPTTPPDGTFDLEGSSNRERPMARSFNEYILEDYIEDMDDGDNDGRLLQDYCALIEKLDGGGNNMTTGMSSDMSTKLASFILPSEGAHEVLPSNNGGIFTSAEVPQLDDYLPSCPQVFTQYERSLPLQNLDIGVEIHFYHVCIKLKGVWINNTSVRTGVDCLLAIPTLENSVVHECSVGVGDRKLSTMVVNGDALREQHTVPKFPQGSLLDATGWAPSVFRFAVPNVMPGDLIEVDMMFTKKLHLQKDCYQLHIPLTFPASIVDQYQGLQVQQLTHLVCCFILAPQGRWSNAGVLLPVDLVFFACR